MHWESTCRGGVVLVNMRRVARTRGYWVGLFLWLTWLAYLFLTQQGNTLLAFSLLLSPALYVTAWQARLEVLLIVVIPILIAVSIMLPDKALQITKLYSSLAILLVALVTQQTKPLR